MDSHRFRWVPLHATADYRQYKQSDGLLLDFVLIFFRFKFPSSFDDSQIPRRNTRRRTSLPSKPNLVVYKRSNRYHHHNMPDCTSKTYEEGFQ